MKNKIYIAIICAFSIVFAVSSGFLIKHYCDSAKQAEMYDNLIEVVETEPEETKEPMNYSEEKTFIPEYQELYLQNNDMVGWIKVEDTKINYPVMQSKDNPNFYLKHGFDKAYTDYGCPYVQENCDMELPSDNIIIYGHHMNDGSMFAGLMKFKDKSFWEKHKTISFDTLTDRQTYEVIAVFKTVVYTDSPDSFKYYQFVNVGGQPYWSWYGFDSRVEWCACFVSWCANECGYIDAGIIPKYAGCVNGVQWFRDRGQWADGSYEPSPGTIIFFDWEGDGVTDHTGIVQKCENGTVYTVEGNSGDTCRTKTYTVGSSVIYGYGIPAY